MHMRPAHTGGLKSKPYFNALNRLYAHYSLRKPAVEPCIPLRIASKPYRQPGSYNLKNTPYRVAFLSTRINEFFISEVRNLSLDSQLAVVLNQ